MTITQQRRRIVTSVVLAVLLTGLVVAVAASLPLFSQIQAQKTQTGAAGAAARGVAFASEFARFQDIAQQTASRSEVAARLESYVQGNVTRDELVRYSAPRLSDALERIADAQAMLRLDHQGRELLRLGPLAEQLPAEVTVSDRVEIRAYPVDDGENSSLFVVTSAPVHGRDGHVVGHDVLLFSMDALKPLFVDVDELGSTTTICLVDRQRGKRVAYDPSSGVFSLRPLGDCLDGLDPAGERASTMIFTGTDDSGVRHVSFLYPLEGAGWDFRIRTPASTFYSGLYRDVAFVLLTLVALMLAAGWLTSRMLGPLLHRLAGQAEQIEQANVNLLEAASVFEQSQEAIVITDRDGVVIRANPGFTEMLGIDAGKQVGASLLDLVDFDRSDDDLMEHIIRRIRVDDAWQGEVWYKRADGSALPALQTISAVRDSDGNLIRLIHVFNDISERMRAERHMQRLAHYDELTGLPNRPSLEKSLADSIIHAARRGVQFAVLFLDLDKFKPVNDSLGHQAGDHLLKRVGQRLRNSVRSRDIVGRLGGDEFLLITDDLRGADDAGVIADKIIDSLKKPFQVDQESVEIGVSIGIAVYPVHGSTSEALVNAADKALYTVKNGGRGFYAFADPVNSNSHA